MSVSFDDDELKGKCLIQLTLVTFISPKSMQSNKSNKVKIKHVSSRLNEAHN